MIETLVSGFSSIMDMGTLLFILMGTSVGIVFGASPGLTTSMGLVFLLPITFALTPVDSLALLAGLYVGGTSGGLITAILLNIPGTPGAIATTFDGHPMARKGLPGKALGIGIVSSFVGSLVGFLILYGLLGPLTTAALAFTPFDYFGITLFAVTLIGGLAGKSPLKGIAAAVIGMLLASVGSAPIDGFPRFNFGWRELNAGFHLLPVLIGVYAVTEILKYAEGQDELGDVADKGLKIKGFGMSLREFREQAWNMIRSSLLGLGIGTLPGLGAGQANIIAYSIAKQRSKYPEKFGTGITDGVVASESSNNAVIGGALIPTLAMGIPGDAATAVLLGGLMLHGVSTGPLLMQNSPDLVYALFAALLVSSLMMLLVQYFGIRVFVRLLRVPKYYLLPVIIVLTVVGAFSLQNRVFDCMSILLFGVLGYGLHRFEYPAAPLVLGFILSPIIEINLRRALIFSDGSYLEFLTRPISAGFILVTVLVMIFAIFKHIRNDRETQQKGMVSDGSQ